MKQITNSRFFIPACIVLIVIICFISRLPQLLSPNLLLDEDECVLGLMAKHMIEGKEVSIFFWGQTYGFSLIETGIISFFYLLFGQSDYSVKLAMLTLFSAAIVFFYKTMLAISSRNKWLALGIALLLVLSPAWAVWSMKARGGYLTAFLLSSICAWILFKQKKRLVFTYLLLGILLTIIFYSQPLWLPGLVAYVVFDLLKSDKSSKLFNILAGVLPTVLIFESFKKNNLNIWSPKVFDFSMPHLQQLSSLLFDHLHGYYYLVFTYKPSFSAIIFAYIFIVLIALLIFIGIRLIFENFNLNKLLIFSVLPLLLTLGYAAFLSEHTPRYLLPISGFSLLALYVYLDKLDSFKINLGVISPLMLIGLFAIYSFKNYSFNPYDRNQLTSCVDYLQGHDLNYIICNDVPTEWQILFYSKEKIICRESNNIDRFPPYIRQVDKAYKESRQHTAVVDFSGDLQDMVPDKVKIVAEKFFIVPDPDRQLLNDMEVKF